MPTRIIRLRIQFIVEPDDDGFHAYCPDLKGLHAGGRTEKEAIKNAKDGVEAYICSLLKHGDPLPIGVQDGPFMTLGEYIKDGFKRFFSSGRRHAVIEDIELPTAA